MNEKNGAIRDASVLGVPKMLIIVEKVKITDTIIDNQYIKNIIVINY